MWAIAGFVSTSQAGAAFCETGIVHNYLKPLERMPEVRQAPVDQHLPFGPFRVFLGHTNRVPLQVGSGELGFHLSYSPFHLHKHFSPRLDWLVTAQLTRVDRRGRSIELLGRIKKQVKRLRSSDDRPRDTLHFSFEVSNPALYRVEIAFRGRSKEMLARYGEYIRVLRPRFDAQLALDRSSFRPGEVVSPRLENYGTESLFYGLDYSIESYDGVSWTPAPIKASGIVPAIGLGTGPGGAASCWNFRIPMDAPPGLYRFVREVEHAAGLFGHRGEPIALTAEFDIAP